VGEAKALARQAHRSDWVDGAARIGLLAYGLVHVVVGWLALQLATGDRAGHASGKGAIRELAEQPFGLVVVWLVAVGLLLLALWRAIEALVGHREDEGFTRTRRRLTSAGRTVVYGYLAWSAFSIALGGGSSGGGTESTTARLMSQPGGQVLVATVGVVIVAIGVALVRRAWTDRFAEEMDQRGLQGTSGTVYVWLGKIGTVSKGAAFGIVGALFGWAAVTHEPDKSGGLDQALAELLDKPLGPYLLAVIALGFVAYGAFCVIQAWHFDR
jgi:hypothetical protein